MSEQTGFDRVGGMRAVLEEFEGPLLGYAARLTGNAEAARDVVQEVFLRLCREGAELNGRMPQWLFAVCRNLAIDAKRKGGRMTTMTAMSPAMESILAARPECAAGANESGEANRDLLVLLETLPEGQQEVVRLRLGAGLSYKQIAEVTGHSMSNVGFLMHVGLKTLRERLGKK